MRRLGWIFAAVLALAGFYSHARAEDQREPYQEFEQVCLSIFAQRASDSENAAGNQICKCASKESKHQGVTVPELRKETAKIRKNPQYKIRNQKLLAAFQYCVVLAMDEKSHEEDPASSK